MILFSFFKSYLYALISLHFIIYCPSSLLLPVLCNSFFIFSPCSSFLIFPHYLSSLITFLTHFPHSHIHYSLSFPSRFLDNFSPVSSSFLSLFLLFFYLCLLLIRIHPTFFVNSSFSHSSFFAFSLLPVFFSLHNFFYLLFR